MLRGVFWLPWVCEGLAFRGREFPGAMAPPPAPPPPPPPPPDPLPPIFPVTSQEDCLKLEKATVVDPAVTCEHVMVSANWDGCMCTVPLPGNINPMPHSLFNPFAVDIPPDPDIPALPALPTVPPPSNPLAAFVPPMMVPDCPYQKACLEEDTKCVGFNSWGFSEARKGKYSPASRHFNAIYCFYIMKPYDRFKVPPRIEGYWRLQEEEKEKAKQEKKPDEKES